MLPLSFAEYYSFMGKNLNKKETFNDYIKLGAFPYIATLPKENEIIKTYIDGIYNTILIKDIAKREKITDISVLDSVIRFLCDNIGSPVSVKKISDTINSSERKISVNTIDNYLRALTDSYIFYKVSRYDIKGKQYLKTLGKYYLIDTGFKNMLLSAQEFNIGHQLENIVYFELLRRGYKVNIRKIAEKEIDFVVSLTGELNYYQISATTFDENMLERELEPLQKIDDNYPKFLLTLDEHASNANYGGILKKNLIDWLLLRK
jgi:predicted AAA+ superfamily ATPase